MKKATSKRERKYGKSIEDEVAKKPIESKKKEVKVKKDIKGKVRVMVDYAMILKFDNIELAKAHIRNSNNESKEKGYLPTSFVIL